MKRFLFFAIMLFIYSLSLHSQGVVVSEYFNEFESGNIKPNGEWAELIVTKDGISLAGCKIRDNSSTGDWMPAFEFKDIPLWKNLHEGTIIMVYFKTAPVVDDDKSDGYIQVSAEDTKYFTFLGSDPARSLNLNQTRDMVQILDQTDNPIHTLGHAKSGDEGIFNAITVPNKICYSDEITPNTGVEVLPGALLGDYNMGYDAAKKYTVKFTTSENSPGLPNKSVKYPTSNIDFWRTLRQPEWNNPTFSTRSINSFAQVILTWKPISNTASDPVEGYILLRAESNIWPAGSLPVDSKIYSAGDMIGSAVVVDHIQKLSTDIYTDKTRLECGKTYIYALFAYRYNADDFREDQNKKELSARGRAYNEINYATTSPILIAEPRAPRIFTINDIKDICRGDELTIFLKDTNMFKDCSFIWVKDGIDIPGETGNKITVTQGGNYSIRVINSIGCESISSVIKIVVRDAPTVVIQDNATKKKFLNDTTLYICNGTTLQLVAQITGNRTNVQWLKDGVIVLEGLTKYSLDVTTSGVYQVLCYDGICPGKSAIITVKILEVNLRVTPTALNLDYDKNPIGTITLTNLTDYELVLQATDIQMPPGFTIINPAAPYVIPARYFLNIDIRFDIPDFKTVTGKMEINTPCDSQYVVDLTGVRKKPNSTYPVAEFTNIDFGIIPNCQARDTSFVISMVGTDTIIIKSDKNLDKYLAYTVVYDTGEQNPNLPWKLNDGNITVYVAFSNIIPGIYPDEIVLDYTVNGVDAAEPLKISLTGETQVPTLDVLDDFTKFKFQLFGCDNTMDTIIRVTNQSPFDITINNNFTVSQIKFKLLPQLIHPKDTVDLAVTLTAGIYIPTTFSYEPCSVKSENITVEISAVAPDMVFSIANNTLDFGEIDNCQFPGDSIIKVAFSGNGVASTIGAIKVPAGMELVGLDVGDNVPTPGGQFEVDFLWNSNISIDDKIEITLLPCNIKKEINVKGSRFTPLAPLVSDTIIDFGEYILGDPYIEKILSITNNDTRDITIRDIKGIKAPFVLVNNDLPYLLKAGETKDYKFRYESTIESNIDVSDLTITYDSYCFFDKHVQLKGKSTTGIEPANIKLSIQNNVSIGLGKTVMVPVLIQVTDTSTLAKCGIKKVKFGIKYDPKVLDLVNAKVGNAIKSQISSFNMVQKSLGYYEISFDVNSNYNIIAGDLAELEFLGLLGDTTDTEIEIISPELSSEIRMINLQIENGSARVTGHCELNNRRIELNGQQGGIIAIEPNPVTDNVSITIEVISDDLTNCGIYDYLGKNVRSMINESLKPDVYKYQLNLNDLQSGVYYIVFKNGIIISTSKLIINK